MSRKRSPLPQAENPWALIDEEIAHLRRTLKVELGPPSSEADLAAFREGLEAHRRFVEVLQRHLEERPALRLL
jgi:hypothetical protein